MTKKLAFVGFVNAVFSVGDMVNALFDKISTDFDLEIYDTGVLKESNLLFDGDNHLRGISFDSNDFNQVTISFEVGNREWTLFLFNKTKNEILLITAWFFLILGIIISILVIYIYYNETMSQEQIKSSLINYQELFQNSPVSIWIEDFSNVKNLIDNLQIETNDKFEQHLQQHPEIIKKCAKLVKINNVNQATLDLLKVKDKLELSTVLEKKYTGVSYNVFKQQLIAIHQGRSQIELESELRLSDGSILIISLRWSVTPRYKKSLSRVLVSMVNITDQKNAVKEIDKKVIELQKSN